MSDTPGKTCASGQSTWLTFKHVEPGQRCTLTLSGENRFVTLIEDSPPNLQWSDRSLSFTTSEPGDIDFVVGLEIFAGDLPFILDMPEGATLRIQILDAWHEYSSGSHDFSFGHTPPPTCSYSGCTPESPDCSPLDGSHERKCYLYQGQFYCCAQPPY